MRNFQTKANRGALPDSITAEKFGAGEFNSLATEAKTAVSRAGLVLADSAGTGEDTTQLAQAMFLNGTKAQAFQAGGTANAIQLTPVSGSSGVKLPPDYSTMDGAKFRFKAAASNTSATTVNVGQTAGTLIGSKPLLSYAGAALTGGEIQSGVYYDVVYSLSDDSFIMLETQASETVRGVVELATSAETIAGTSDKLGVHPAGLAAVIASIQTTDVVARDQIALTNIRLMLSTSVSTGALVQGYQWELSSDEWGATSTNEIYVSGTPNYYSNGGTGYQLISGATGTNLGTCTDGGGLAAAFDGNTNKAQAVCANDAGLPADIGKDYGGSPKTPTRIKLYASNDLGFSTGTNSYSVRCFGSNSAYGSGGTQLGTTQTPGSDPAGGVLTFDFANSTAYRYIWAEFYNDGTADLRLAQMEIYETLSVSNMTLIPPAPVGLSVVPTYADVFFLWKDDSGTAVLGTDITVDLSRDGETTFTEATLTNLASIDGTYSIIRARANLSSQPSGTSLSCRIKTLNTKAQRVAAPALYAE